MMRRLDWTASLKSTLLIILSTGLLLVALNHVEVKALTTDQWRTHAQVAWKYFSPGIGVHTTTGISRAKLDWDSATDWDTAGYITAIVDAHKLGLLSYDGSWGFRDRIDKVLRRLETRELGTRGAVPNFPYWAYYWNSSDHRPGFTNWSDSGKLLLALDQLRKYDSSFSTRVQSIFSRCKTAYDVLKNELPVNYYGYLVAHSFAAFGYDMTSVITGFEGWAGPFVNLEGQNLPVMETIAEPMVHGILDMWFSGVFCEYSRRAYECQKSYYPRGKFRAWSEGGYYQLNPRLGYVYEYILTGAGEAWVIVGGTRLTIEPLMYSKIAFAYLAIYGENQYTLALYNAAKNLEHSQYGFGEATFENATSAISIWGSNTGGFYSDKTNQIILGAARYAIEKIVTLQPLSGVNSLIIQAGPNMVYVMLPDYGRGVEYPSHTPLPKGGGVLAALSTDIFACAYVLGSFANGQYEILDTMSAYVSASPVGKPLMNPSYPIFTIASRWVNTVVYYYDSTAQSLLYLTYDGTTHRVLRRAGGTVASITNAERDAGLFDYFVYQHFKDNEGRNVFMVWGVGWKGSYAGAVYFVRFILPNISAYTQGWHVYRWDEATSGASQNSIPDPGDTYTLISSG